MRRYALYSFVISLLWLGFVCSSFVVVFCPALESVDSKTGKSLDAGPLLFLILMKSFIRAEWVSCLFCWIFVVRTRIVRERGTFKALCIATLILLLQSFAMLPSADANLIKESLPWPPWNPDLFMILQGLKGAALGVLSSMSIQAFARAVISE